MDVGVSKSHIALLAALPIAGSTACSTSAVPPRPSTPLGLGLSREACPTANEALDGGLVRVDDFYFDLWPYCDTDLPAERGSPGHATVPGLGVFAAWVYNGDLLEGDYHQEFRCADESVGEFGFGRGLHAGSVRSYSGEVRVPAATSRQAIATGKPITCVVRVSSAGMNRGASLSFVLRQTPKGLDVTSVSVRPEAP
jgi:hypothetical protein